MDTPSDLRKRTDRDPELFVVATDGSEVRQPNEGWDGWRGNMYRLAVDPQHRRLGLARRLVEEGEPVHTRPLLTVP